MLGKFAALVILLILALLIERYCSIKPEPFGPTAEIVSIDGDTLRVGSAEFSVLHTPGHAPGHVVLTHDRTMFGGDLLFAGSIGRTDLLFADPVRMEESLAKVCELADDMQVHPGHGPSTTIGRERATNPFLNGVARIVRR